MSDPVTPESDADARPRLRSRRASSRSPARSATAARLALEYPGRGRGLGRAGAAVARGTGRDSAKAASLASGAIVSLIDTAGGHRRYGQLGHFQPVVTIDLRLDYLRPAVEGETVIARCECYKLTRSIALRPRHRAWRRPGAGDRPQRRDLHAQPLDLRSPSRRSSALRKHIVGRLDLAGSACAASLSPCFRSG